MDRDWDWDPYDADCPTRQVLDHLSGKWTGLVVGRLLERPHRFSELKRSIGGVSQKMLTQTLRALERDGLVRRSVHAGSPPPVTYALTPLGASFADAVVLIQTWTAEHFDEVVEAREAYVPPPPPVPRAWTERSEKSVVAPARG